MPDLMPKKADDLIGDILKTLDSASDKRDAKFTLVLGAGFSAGVVPTTIDLIPLAIEHCRRSFLTATDLKGIAKSEMETPDSFRQAFWRCLKEAELGIVFKKDTDPPEPDLNLQGNVAQLFRTILSGAFNFGLTTPDARSGFLRSITLNASERVNPAHAFLAGILREQTTDSWKSSRPPFCHTLFTTNFDQLLQRSLQLNNIFYRSTDLPETSILRLDENDHSVHIVHCHGSALRHILVANDIDANAQTKFGSEIGKYFDNRGVIVIGYAGGWDDVLMKALSSTSQFRFNLYWCGTDEYERAQHTLNPMVAELLKSKCSQAYYVQIGTANKLMMDLHKVLCAQSQGPKFLVRPLECCIEDLARLEISTDEPLQELAALKHSTVELLGRANEWLGKQLEGQPVMGSDRNLLWATGFWRAMEAFGTSQFEEAHSAWDSLMKECKLEQPLDEKSNEWTRHHWTLARINLARVLIELKNYGDAENLLSEVASSSYVRTRPKIGALALLAEVLLDRARMQDARKALTTIMTLVESSAPDAAESEQDQRAIEQAGKAASARLAEILEDSSSRDA